MKIILDIENEGCHNATKKEETMKYEDINPEYARARNAFIPLAEKKANKAAGKKCPQGNEKIREQWAQKWNGAFHRAMNLMAKDL